MHVQYRDNYHYGNVPYNDFSDARPCKTSINECQLYKKRNNKYSSTVPYGTIVPYRTPIKFLIFVNYTVKDPTVRLYYTYGWTDRQFFYTEPIICHKDEDI